MSHESSGAWHDPDPQCALCGAFLDAANGYCRISTVAADCRCWECCTATDRIGLRAGPGAALAFERRDALELRGERERRMRT